MVNPGPSMRQLRLQESKKKNRPNKRSHPADIREGVASAYMLVKEVSIFIHSSRRILLIFDEYIFVIFFLYYFKFYTISF